MATQTHNVVPVADADFLAVLQEFLREEDADRFVDMFQPFVVSGGLHGAVAGLVGTPSALLAYPDGFYTTETGSITYPDATSFVWVIAHKEKAGNVGTFTRVPGTAYLIQSSVGQPALPADCLYLMQVTTAGGAITAVVDLRVLTPTAAATLFSDAEGNPATVAVTAADGVSSFAARRDHVHRALDAMPIYLTNKTGSGLVLGDVVTIDPANDQAVILLDVANAVAQFVVSTGVIGVDAIGPFMRAGVATVRVAEAVQRGNYIKKAGAGTPGAAEDGHISAGISNALPQGTFAFALTGFAGPGLGTLTACLLGMTYAGAASSTMPRSYGAGCGLTNSAGDVAHDIDIAAGAWRASDNTEDLVLPSVLTKQLDAGWAAGTGAGGLFSGGIAATTQYFVFLIRRDSDGLIDAGFDTSEIAANRPVGWSTFRRVGTVWTDGASAIRPFTQTGDLVLLTTPILDLSGDLTEAATLRTLSVPPNAEALLNVSAHFSGADQVVYLTPVAVTDAAPSIVSALGTITVSSGGNGGVYGPFRIRVDANRQIRSRTTGTLGGAGLNIATLGWIDRRGRDD